MVTQLQHAGLPALAFPAASGAVVEDRNITRWELEPIQSALEHNLIPVVYGDVVFDAIRGGTILSTEDIFSHLARQLKPRRILIAGIEEGVWEDYPVCTKLVPEITSQTAGEILPAIQGSAATDVTGGMAAKVTEMLKLVEEIPELEVSIFSAEKEGTLAKVFAGENIGTRLHNQA